MRKLLFITVIALLSSQEARTQNWVPQNANPFNGGFDFLHVSVVNSTTVMGISSPVDLAWPHTNYLSRTIDGGATWSSAPIDSNLLIVGFTAVNADTAWIATDEYSGQLNGNWNASVYQTVDGGTTWTRNMAIPFDSNSYVDGMHFFNANDGVAFGDVHNSVWDVFYTSDGGVSWNASTVPAPQVSEFCMDMHMYAYGDNVCMTSSEGGVYRSSDKGVTWSYAQIGAFSFPMICRVAFYDALEGIAVVYNFNTGLTASVFRTHDGGATWSQQAHTGSIFQSFSNGEADLFIVPGSNAVFANSGRSGGPFGCSYSIDSGATWTVLDNSIRYGAMDGKGWNSFWTGQYSSTLGTGGIAKWDGVALGINVPETKSSLSIAPNPSNGIISILLTGNVTSEMKLCVSDITGKTAFECSMPAYGNSINATLDLGHLAAGSYIVRLYNDETSISRKLIIDHD
jgi:photosystem II stability/assembly factor-like uncharacterized protein